MSSTSNPNPHDEVTTSGIAVLQSTDTDTDTPDPFGDDTGPFPVSGIAMAPGAFKGGSGVRLRWPPEVLEDAAPLLAGKSIVTDFHPAEPTPAPQSAIVGQVTDSGYADGQGIAFEGEVSDRDVARKIDRGYLEVSVRAALDSQRPDPASPNPDAMVVESISDFIDIAVVDRGASEGNSIEYGPNPAVASLSRHALDGFEFPSDSDSESSDDVDPEPEGLKALIAEDLSIKTPDRCKTIKDGSKEVDVDSPLARGILGTDSRSDDPVNIDDPVDEGGDSVARQALGIDRSADDPDEIDIRRDPIGRQAAGFDPIHYPWPIDDDLDDDDDTEDDDLENENDDDIDFGEDDVETPDADSNEDVEGDDTDVDAD